jgi:hypothetical protein
MQVVVGVGWQGCKAGRQAILFKYQRILSTCKTDAKSQFVTTVEMARTKEIPEYSLDKLPPGYLVHPVKKYYIL